jgi:hypothetical protein
LNIIDLLHRPIYIGYLWYHAFPALYFPHAPTQYVCHALLLSYESFCSFFFKVGIQNSNIRSIAILWLVYMGYIAEGKCFQSSFILYAHKFDSGYIMISEGDPVFIPHLGNQQIRGDWGTDAKEFNPDRWASLPEVASQVPGVWGRLTTFLARACIGYRFPLVEYA